GHDPSRRIICVSHSDRLSTKFSNDCRHVLSSSWFQQAFPNCLISPEKNTEMEFMTTMRGGRFSTTPSGSLTGLGGSLFLLDDVLDTHDMSSAAAHAKKRDWYEGSLSTRPNSKTDDAIVIIQQRLHPDDLAGVALQKGGFHHLNLPAIAP